MPMALTRADKLMCPHAGQVQLLPSRPLLTVGGKAVIVKPDVPLNVPASISGCTTPISQGSAPCLLCTSTAPSGVATRLTVAGNPVLLSGLTGDTSGKVGGTPQKLLPATASQALLSAT